ARKAAGAASIRHSLRPLFTRAMLCRTRADRAAGTWSRASKLRRHSGATRSGEPGIHTHDRGYGFRARASKSALADLDNPYSRTRVDPSSVARPGMTI